jgi:ABC-type nitrate/sulfonate/bicarbonate transport system permease component
MAFVAVIVLSLLGAFGSLLVRVMQRKLVWWQAS